MRDNDQIILEKCYSNINSKTLIKEEANQDIYRVLLKDSNLSIDVDTANDDLHLDETPEVYIKFKLEAHREQWGLNIFVHLLEIEPFKIKLVEWTEDENKEFFFDIPGVDISHVNTTFDLTKLSEEDSLGSSWVQITPRYVEFEIVPQRGDRGIQSLKTIGYKINPKSVEVDFRH